MKTLLAILLVLAGLSATFNLKAQFSLGAGIAYGFEVEEIGIQVQPMYQFSDSWRGAANFIYYLDGIENFSFWELNLNAHYLFADTEKFNAYGLAGLNIYGATISFLGESETATETGLNLGVGGQYLFSEKIGGFGELKYAISDADQLVIGLGVFFKLGK